MGFPSLKHPNLGSCKRVRPSQGRFSFRTVERLHGCAARPPRGGRRCTVSPAEAVSHTFGFNGRRRRQWRRLRESNNSRIQAQEEKEKVFWLPAEEAPQGVYEENRKAASPCPIEEQGRQTEDAVELLDRSSCSGTPLVTRPSHVWRHGRRSLPSAVSSSQGRWNGTQVKRLLAKDMPDDS